MIKLDKLKYLSLYAVVALPSIVFAQAGPPGGGTFENPLDAGTIPVLLTKVLHLLVQIGIPVLVIFIVYAGLQFVTAQGSPEKITKARSALFWAVIGGGILLGAQIMADVLEATVKSL